MTVFCSVENNVVSSFMQQDINSSEIVFLLQQDATTRERKRRGDVLKKLKATADGKLCGLSLLQHGIALFQVMPEPLCIQWLTGGLTYQFIGTEQAGFFPDVVF